MERSFRESSTHSPTRGPVSVSTPAADVLTSSAVYAIIAGLSGLLVSQWFSPNDSVITVLLIVFFAVMLAVRFWVIALMLLLIQAGLFLVEPGSLNAFGNSEGSAFLTIAVLTLLISASRYLTLTSSPLPYRLSNRASIKVAVQHARRTPRRDFAAFGVLPRQSSTIDSTEVVTLLVRIVVPVAVVSVLLAAVPLDPAAPEYARLIPPAVRTITIGVILLLICVLTNSLLSALAWRRLSPAESRMFLRSELSQWIHREVSAVARGRIKSRASRRNGMS